MKKDMTGIEEAEFLESSFGGLDQNIMKKHPGSFLRTMDAQQVLRKDSPNPAKNLSNGMISV